MIVYGASGHGKVIIEIMEANRLKPYVIWDDSPGVGIWEYRVRKPDHILHALKPEIIIAIGDNRVRKMIAEKNKGKCSFLKLVHPGACVSGRSEIGVGTVVMDGAVVNPDASIGEHCIINTKAVVEHDCIIGNWVHISPNATLCGNVSVGEGTHIGAGAVVIPGKKIGKWCTIGAGSVIIRDVPDHCTVVGNPGKIIRQLEALQLAL
jgi:sugar O-acyltransferase (sialic acid O-acetyltransferase NeuD family)